MIKLIVYPNSDDPEHIPMPVWINPDHISAIEEYKPPHRTTVGSKVTMQSGREHHIHEIASVLAGLMP